MLYTEMKKYILAFTLLCISLLSFTGCGKNELKDVRAQVTSIEVKRDTLMSMKATVDGDTLLFSLKDARFNNGIMLHGDSVIIDYIKGRGDTLRALVVTILPKAPSYFNPDEAKNDTLAVSSPLEPEKDINKDNN